MTSVSCFQLAGCILVFFVCEGQEFHVLVVFLGTILVLLCGCTQLADCGDQIISLI
jgi:hypothetical protein